MADNENNGVQTVHGLSVEQSLLGAVNTENQEPDEEYEIIAVEDLVRVKLGRQGENETQTVRIDCNEWLVQLQGCTFMVVALRPGETELYVPDITVSNGLITWPITAQDTACSGAGRAEVRALKGDAVKKSKLFRTWIEPALEGAIGTPVTPPNWVKETKEALDQANTLMADALAAANEANEAAENLDDEVAAAKTDALDAIAAAKSDAQEAASDSMTDIAEARDAGLDAIDAAQAAAVADAAEAMNTAKDDAVAAGEAALEAAKDAKVEEINAAKTNAEQIAASAVEVAENANDNAVQALTKANNAENDAAAIASDVDELKNNWERYEVESSAFFASAFHDEDNDTLYFVDKNNRVVCEVPNIGKGGGGGGGGGDSGSSSVVKLDNISGWNTKTVAQAEDGSIASLPVTLRWSSIENEMATGDGSLYISVNSGEPDVIGVSQGEVVIDVAKYIKAGVNRINFEVYDVYGKHKNTIVTVDVKSLYLTTIFDDSPAYKGAISYSYTPNGTVRKTVYFEMDGDVIGTVETSVSGHQQSFTIPKQAHGSHVLRVWFEAEVNGQTVRSNTLYHELICIDPLATDPIITSDFNQTTAVQYETLGFDYHVYDPLNLEAPVTIDVNGEEAASLTVNRETQHFEYRVSEVGTLSIAINSGSTTKSFTLDVSDAGVHPEAVTDQLSLYLNAAGRSNSEAIPGVWEWGSGSSKIAATFTGFNWTRDGWVRDEIGLTTLRCLGGSKAEIPALIFGRDFRSTGKTIEVEFKSHNVLSYDTPIISCMSGNRGFEIYADHLVFKSARAEIKTRFLTDRRMRVTLAVEPQSAHRLVYLYIDGEYQGISQYSATDSFQQADPVGITVGGNARCGVDLYNWRVYDRYLTMDEVLTNFIADRQDAFEMLKLYHENNIYDENGIIRSSLLPRYLPYVIFKGAESPQYKGDKKHVVMDYVEPGNDARRLHAEGVLVNVQGTSSQYYAVKNLKITFENGATVNGRLVIGFTIRDGSIMVDTFTLKADVASSESANNILLAKIFDELARKLGIITPAQQKNEAIRQGMDGFACVGFWDYGDGEVFIGKMNFNNDKGTFEVFGFEEGDQCWDVRNNTSQLSKFHTNEFGENWYTEDYESIYPEDSSDLSQIKPMTDFLYSTWQEGATGDALPSPVTYEGVEYTNDTAAYRLAKFKAGFPDVYHLRNSLYYYCYTLGLMMVDSRQKNEHLYFIHELMLWWELIYDCDTALGTDNRGGLAFEHWVEDTDIIDGEYVFNGADNVKWVNLRQAFWNELADMWEEMRASGMFSAEYLEQRFTEWQAKWPKAIRNADSKVKYTDPLEKDGTTTYLPMGQGSKAWQRPDILKWRFAYMDSLFDRADAMKSIMLRPYYEVTEEQRAAGAVNIRVKVYKKSYVTMLFDDIKVSHRLVGDDLTVEIQNPQRFANDAVWAIHNALLIEDVFGLENVYVGYWDSSYAENLQAIRLGSDAEGYVNTATKFVSAGANTKLWLVQLTGCVNLGTDTQKTLSLDHCPNLKEVYATRTKLQGVDLPNGGVLDTLKLPATTSSLVIRNQPRLTDENLVLEGWDNIDQLWLENMTGLDSKAILNRVPAGTAVRITGFYWEVADAAEIDGIMDLLDTMRGIEINGQGQGEEVDDAQMSGTIHASALRGDDIARWKERYPTIDVTADHTSSTKTFKSWDGSTTVGTVEYADGRPVTALPSVPARTETAQYTFTAVGWNTAEDAQTTNFDASTVNDSDLTLYAAYSRTVRSHPITWDPNNGSPTVTETYSYGDMPSRALPSKDGQTATGWTPEITPVTGPATYTATYVPIYTATFVRDTEDGGGTLGTKNYQDGQTVTDDGITTPTSTREGYTFSGWTPPLGAIHADTTYTAKFKAPSDAPTATTADGAYGVEWDYNASATTLTRKGLAASFSNPTPATAVDGSGSSPFDSIAPWKDMKRFNVIGSELVPDTDSRFDEAANDTVVYIPEFYYTAYKDTSGMKWLWAISPTQLEGYKKHPGSGVYVGRFHTSGSESAVFTKGGAAPLANLTRANFRTYSKAKGAAWRQMDLKVWSAIQMLYLVEFANWHSQDVLGGGQNSGSVENTGATTGAAYHTIKRTGNSNAYRWIENPFSNVMTWVDGYVASNRASYISTDPASYGDNTSGLENAGITLPSNGWISGLGYSEKCAWAFIPDTASGSETTYVPDRVSSNTSVYVLCVGGDYYANTYYGLFYFNAYYSASFTYASIGSRLLYQP